MGKEVVNKNVTKMVIVLNVPVSRAFIWVQIKKLANSIHVKKTENGGCDQTCWNEGDHARCSCAKDFKLKEDGKSCEAIHPCDLAHKAGCDQLCKKKGTEYRCECITGYKLK